MGTKSKTLTWVGRVITGLIAVMMVASAIMKLMNRPDVAEQLVGKFGYPAEVTLILGIVEISCVILYVIPQTAVLGAVLLTGYLGGAIATHVRVQDNFVGPVIGGILVWLAVYFRDPRVRALLPIRQPMTSVEPN
jgi:hypothetical protein